MHDVLLLLAAPVLILLLVVAVPVAYRYFWPVRVSRPALFLALTLTMGLIVAAVAIIWFFQAFVGIGIAGATPAAAAASQAIFESVVRNRLLVAAVLAVTVEYLLCRMTQTILGS